MYYRVSRSCSLACIFQSPAGVPYHEIWQSGRKQGWGRVPSSSSSSSRRRLCKVFNAIKPLSPPVAKLTSLKSGSMDWVRVREESKSCTLHFHIWKSDETVNWKYRSTCDGLTKFPCCSNICDYHGFLLILSVVWMNHPDVPAKVGEIRRCLDAFSLHPFSSGG